MSRKTEVGLGIRKGQWSRNTDGKWRTSLLLPGTKVAGVRKRISEEAMPQGKNSSQLKQEGAENIYTII